MKITPAYLAEQKRLHADPRGYGGRGSKWADAVLELTCTTEVERIIDYGAGQGSLGRELRKAGFEVQDYDPAVEKFSSPPTLRADLVTCTDVLEHVEEECLGEVLLDLASLAEIVFVVISLVETSKTLSDGRQAHINLKTREDWIHRLWSAGLELREEIVNKPEKQFIGIFQRAP